MRRRARRRIGRSARRSGRGASRYWHGERYSALAANIRSRILELGAHERSPVQGQALSMLLWTIGHGNLDQTSLLETLRSAQIEVLVDVRSLPWSRRNPQFNQVALTAACQAEGIRYEWLESLGGKPKNRDFWIEDGVPDYPRMAAAPAFNEGIDAVVHLAASSRVALLCSEVRPENCHRNMLLTPPIVARGVIVEHLLPGASTVADVGAPQRLL